MPSDANESVTSSQSISLGLFGAAIAVSAWGSSGVIVKALDLDPVAISFYRFTVYSLAIFLVIRLRGNKPTLRVLKHSAAGGISLGIDVVLFFTAVKTTTIVNATTIGALQPIIVLSIATRFLVSEFDFGKSLPLSLRSLVLSSSSPSRRETPSGTALATLRHSELSSRGPATS